MSNSYIDIEDSFTIGKSLIINAINIDEALTEILKLETKKVKKSLNLSSEMDSVSNLTKTLRSVIIALTLTEEKLKTGINLCTQNKK